MVCDLGLTVAIIITSLRPFSSNPPRVSDPEIKTLNGFEVISLTAEAESLFFTLYEV